MHDVLFCAYKPPHMLNGKCAAVIQRAHTLSNVLHTGGPASGDGAEHNRLLSSLGLRGDIINTVTMV